MLELPHRNKAGTRFNTFLEVNSPIAVTTYFQKKGYKTWNAELNTGSDKKSVYLGSNLKKIEGNFFLTLL